MLPWSRPVALVALRGTIGVAIRAEQWVPLLDGLRKRKSVHAVVLEVDSPGGTVAASDGTVSAVPLLSGSKIQVGVVIVFNSGEIVDLMERLRRSLAVGAGLSAVALPVTGSRLVGRVCDLSLRTTPTSPSPSTFSTRSSSSPVSSGFVM